VPDRPALFTDADVLAIPAAHLIAAMHRALADAHAGRLAAPPRSTVPVHDGGYVFTVGGYRDGPAGFRVYATGRPDQQATLLWDEDGRLVAVVVGNTLGERRTGALGGVAVDLLARPDAEQLAMVGTGRQAWAQLWAISAVRRLRAVRVYSPTVQHRVRFAERAASELGLAAAAVDTARAAVSGADVVVLATRSGRPVIDANWVAPGTHVSTVGPKTRSAHECPADLPARAGLVTTDAPEQVRSYPEPCFTDRGLVALGAIAAGEARARRDPEEITFYLSTGLAGTEVVAARELLGRHGG
jgi:alanine dehydrogenase